MTIEKLRKFSRLVSNFVKLITCGKAVETFPDPQMCFPVIARKFPVRLKKFPVPSLREFAKIIEQCQCVTGKFEARSGCFCKNSLFFPCLTGKSPLRPQRQVRRRLPAPPPYAFAVGWQATQRRLGVGVSAVALAKADGNASCPRIRLRRSKAGAEARLTPVPRCAPCPRR